MVFRHYAFCLCFNLMLSPAVTAFSPVEEKAKPIEIANILIENLQENKHFAYDNIWREMYSRLDVSVNTYYYPPARALSYFLEHKFDCLFPVDIRFLDGRENLIQSKPINYAKVYLVSKNAGTHYRNIDAKGLRMIAVQRGYTYGGIIDDIHPNRQMVVNSIEQQIGLLMKDRVDAILIYVPDLYLVTPMHQISKLWFAKSKPLSVHEENLVCWDNKQTRQMIARVNTLLKEIELERLLGAASTHFADEAK